MTIVLKKARNIVTEPFDGDRREAQPRRCDRVSGGRPLHRGHL